MHKKRLLILGGAFFQLSVIKHAKKLGYYVITCDYLPDNPGHKFSDEYHNVSTTNLEGVLELAKKLKIDGILAYASDPAAPTAAYISEKLNLHGNPYKSVKILAEKDLFRDFLSRNNFNVPYSKGYALYSDILEDIDKFTFPIMVKPVDSSGSKGVSKIINSSELEKAFNFALSHSRNKRIIVEEFIDSSDYQLHGDAFVFEGKVVFCYLGDQYFNERVNPIVPISTTLPSVQNKSKLLEIENELQRLITILNIKNGAFNVEAKIDLKGRMFLIEVGPRSGGNLVPQLEQYASGFNIVEASIEIAMGNYKSVQSYSKKGYYAQYILHSEIPGKFNRIVISNSLENNVLEKHIFKARNEEVSTYNGSNTAIGVLLLQFSTAKEMHDRILNMSKYVKVELM